MKKTLFSFSAVLILISSKAQEITKRCYTTEKYQQVVAENPEILSKEIMVDALLFLTNLIAAVQPILMEICLTTTWIM